MGKYFILHSTTHFCYSSNEGCLYNTLNGNVIALNRRQKDLLLLSESGTSIDGISAEEITFYNDLDDKALGYYSTNPVSVEPTFWGENTFFNKAMGSKRKIDILQIEISEKCNFNCIFCNENSKTVYRKTGCKRWEVDKNNKLDLKAWKGYIEQAILLGCKKIQFFGGEPFLEWHNLKELIEFSSDKGIKDIEVYTNGSLLSDDKLEFVREKEVKLVIQITNKKNNKKVLGISEDIDYEELLMKWKEEKIKFEILILVSKYNDKYLNDYIQKLHKVDCKCKVDFIHPYPQNDYFSEKYKESILDFKKKLLKTNPSNVGELMLYNPCYSKTLAISARGKVYPCIMSRYTAYGIVDGSNSLVSTLNEEYEMYRSLSKNKMVSCKECVFRYACLGCSAIEISASKGLFSSKNCSLIEK